METDMKRDLDNKVFFGVCSGLSKVLDVSPNVLRWAFVVSTIFFGTGLGIYLTLLIIMLIVENN
jgi:phage shock protein PspC (stress-responsive transcriptional regulator)